MLFGHRSYRNDQNALHHPALIEKGLYRVKESHKYSPFLQTDFSE